MSKRNRRRSHSRALRDAILAGNAATATALVEAGVEVDPPDTEHGETALTLATHAGYAGLIGLLPCENSRLRPAIWLLEGDAPRGRQ